jgi:hypothetical protein
MTNNPSLADAGVSIHKGANGLVIPIPTLPVEVIRNHSALLTINFIFPKFVVNPISLFPVVKILFPVSAPFIRIPLKSQNPIVRRQ